MLLRARVISFDWIIRTENAWPRLLERCITLSTEQITIQFIALSVLLTPIQWIVIYPVLSSL